MRLRQPKQRSTWRAATVAAVAVALACLLAPGRPATAPAEPPDTIIVFNGLRVNWRAPVFLVKPGEKVQLRFAPEVDNLAVSIEFCDGHGQFECRFDHDRISLTAPKQAGTYPARVRVIRGQLHPEAVARDWINLTVLVGYSRDVIQDGVLNGYELGEYPSAGRDASAPPEYFHYLTEDTAKLYLSEHIRLGELAHDVRGPMPQYFALKYDLVKKLEAIKAELEHRGLPARFHWIGGGYISPKSNAERVSQNGGAARMSRHLYGEAMDFLIDQDPLDDEMDDLDGDGRSTVMDAIYLRRLVRDLEAAGKCAPGGVGVYAPPNDARVQVHVDVRGQPISWGFTDRDNAYFAHADKRRPNPGGGR